MNHYSILQGRQGSPQLSSPVSRGECRGLLPSDWGGPLSGGQGMGQPFRSAERSALLASELSEARRDSGVAQMSLFRRSSVVAERNKRCAPVISPSPPPKAVTRQTPFDRLLVSVYSLE